YGDHRDLHSFPTRRSSDLESRNADKTYNKIAATELDNQMGSFDWAALANGAKIAGVTDIIVRQPSYFEGFAKVLDSTDLQSWQEDRKSTRLNSSHVKISYA